MKIRIQPWLTDACVRFLNNLFKWYPSLINTPVTVLEWGGGNSTLYFLAKNCKVLTVESDEKYISSILEAATSLGFSATIGTSPSSELFHDFDLVILKASSYEEIGDGIFDIMDWTIILNDGISRKEVLQSITTRRCSSIVILDNIEYCANWGALERASAHPDRVKVYRKVLRDPKWKHCIFEQAEGRDQHSSADATGWEAPHRWLSGVLWHQDHLLAELMVSHLGIPVVTSDAIDNLDLETLPERCPFDWNTMSWVVDKYTETFDFPRDYH